MKDALGISFCGEKNTYQVRRLPASASVSSLVMFLSLVSHALPLQHEHLETKVRSRGEVVHWSSTLDSFDAQVH